MSEFTKIEKKQRFLKDIKINLDIKRVNYIMQVLNEQIKNK